jgi:hypothetical protein
MKFKCGAGAAFLTFLAAHSDQVAFHVFPLSALDPRVVNLAPTIHCYCLDL